MPVDCTYIVDKQIIISTGAYKMKGNIWGKQCGISKVILLQYSVKCWKMFLENGSIKERAQPGRPSRGIEPCAGANHQNVAH